MNTKKPPHLGIVVEDMIVRTSNKVIEPLNDMILIRPTAADRTAAGLVMPDNVETQKKAIVAAVGPGKLLEDGTRRAPQIAVGDRVVLRPGTAHGVDVTGEVLYLCREEDVIARVVEPGVA